MSKTEIILTHNVVGLGAESDQLKVAAGYARNFLFPQGLAIPVTAANKRQLQVLRERRALRETRDLQAMTQLSETLARLTLTITMKTGDDGKLFGSVTAGTIADELKTHYDAAVDKRKIHLERPIKSLGDHEVELRLHQNLTTVLKVKIVSTTPAPEVATVSSRDAGAKDSTSAKPGGRASKGEARKDKEAPAPAGKADAKPSPSRSGKGAKAEKSA
jgi:large subunit ribosomal protein L9